MTHIDMHIPKLPLVSGGKEGGEVARAVDAAVDGAVDAAVSEVGEELPAQGEGACAR